MSHMHGLWNQKSNQKENMKVG
jgi:hypothetical protein